MTNNDGVPKLVMQEIKLVTAPGQPVSNSVIKAAYVSARKKAIVDTINWKRKFITIEETI